MEVGLTVNEFKKLAEHYRMVPVWREEIADLVTPVSVLTRLSSSDYVFALESAEQGVRIGRYSFICFDPLMVFESRGNNYLLVDGERVTSGVTRDPLATLSDAMANYRSPAIEGLPPLLSGCLGYVGYEYVRFLERLPSLSQPLRIPDILMVVPRCVLAFDHVKRTLVAVVNCTLNGENAASAYSEAVEDLDRLVQLALSSGKQGHAREMGYGQGSDCGEGSNCNLESICKGQATRAHKRASEIFRTPLMLCDSTVDRQTFEGLVRKAKQYIVDGDIFQVVLSRRLSIPVRSHPLTVYRMLRSLNPSPYMFYLNFGCMQIIGASPEMLVKLQGKVAELRPIAGTRRRGKTQEEDKLLEAELMRDVKERAEHVMLVDLGRNDLGRVCVPGTVRVPDFMHVERYSHVMHIVSSITGELSDKFNQYDLFRSAFPAGTVTGAPKVRAMEIIEELEHLRRGVYAGAIGYFGSGENMDMCIAIRTVLIAGGRAYVQAGAGIVADSDPAREYDETESKALAVIRALELAESEK